MPKTKKPRKAYRPRAVIANPVGYVLEGMTRISRAEVVRMLTANHAAMMNLTKGEGTVDDWRVVTGALNMAAVLDEQVYDCAYQDELSEALKAHGRCGVRRWNGGNFGYTGPDLQIVNFALSVHDEQMTKATVGEIERALAETERRSRNPKEHISVRQMAQQQKEQTIG